MYKFDSKVRFGGQLRKFTEVEIKNETMFYSAKPSFAYMNGGPITRNFLEKFTEEHGKEVMLSNEYCFDSRVHMLMEGWYPCIPGWHHDDIPRSRGDGQPNYQTPEYRPQHCLGLVGADVSATDFAVGRCELPHTDGVVYRDWHPLVDGLVDSGQLSRVPVPDRTLAFFDDHAFHQGTKAVKNGWRWFGRITWNAGYPKRTRHNEIRRQVNVYMDNPMDGW